MSTWAAVAAKEAALTSSAGASLLHGITPGAIDGFAVGALLTGSCFLVVAAPRMLRRTRLSGRDGMWGTGTRRIRARHDYFATPTGSDAAAADPDAAADSDLYVAPVGGNPYAPPTGGDPFTVVADDDIILPGTGSDEASHDESGRSGYRSKHRMASSDAERRADARRTPPRHAAPSAGLVSWMSGRFAASPLAARG